jgi:hypothetical protein
MTGSGGGPDLMDIINLLGAEEARRRIQKAIEQLA